jgi:hypothetical protein
MKTLTWPQIVNNFLKKNYFDCLKSNDKKCYCQVDNLFQCAFDTCTFDCIPGKIKELSGEFTRI